MSASKAARIGSLCAIAYGLELIVNAASYFIRFAPAIGASSLELLQYVAANLGPWMLFWSNGILLSLIAIPVYLLFYHRFKAARPLAMQVACGLGVASSLIYIPGILIGLDTTPILARALAASPQAAPTVILAHELFSGLQTLLVDQLAMPLQSLWAVLIGWEMIRRRDPVAHLGWLGVIAGLAGVIGTIGLSPGAFFLPGFWMYGKGLAYAVAYPAWFILTGVALLRTPVTPAHHRRPPPRPLAEVG